MSHSLKNDLRGCGEQNDVIESRIELALIGLATRDEELAVFVRVEK